MIEISESIFTYVFINLSSRKMKISVSLERKPEISNCMNLIIKTVKNKVKQYDAQQKKVDKSNLLDH